MTKSVVFVTDHDITNHAVGTRTKYIAKEWVGVDYKVNLVTKNDSFKFSNYEEEGLFIFKLPSLSKFNSSFSKIDTILFVLFNLFFLLKLNIKEKPYFIFSVGIFSSFSSLLTKSFNRNTKFVQDVPGIVPLEKKIRKKGKGLVFFLTNTLTNYTFHKSDILSTINKNHALLLYSIYNKSQVVIVRDAADKERFSHIKNTSLRNKEKIGEETCIILFVGSLSFAKLDDLISVLPNIKNLDVQVIIIGSGKLKKNYIDKIQDLGLDDILIFKGYVSDKSLVEYLSISDIAYSDFWSKYGFPRKVFEYLSMGKPIIVQSSNPIREVLEDGHNSFLYTNLDEFETKLMRLINEPDLRKSIGKNALLTSEAYTWDVQVNNLKEYLIKNV